MRLVVFSDSHGRGDGLEAVVEAQKNADCYIYLGDGWSDARRLQQRRPELPLVTVKGNCDYGVDDEDDRRLELAGKRVLVTHGHRFGVKYGLGELEDRAKELRADLVLFGHTHTPLCENHDGIYYINPGSLAFSSSFRFATADIEPNGAIICHLARLSGEAQYSRKYT